MVRSGSNSKRVKSNLKHHYSQEAPANLNFYSTPKATAAKKGFNLSNSNYGNHSHSHSLSLAPHHFSETIGLSSSQAIKRLVEEIDRIIANKKRNDDFLIKLELKSGLRYALLIILSSIYVNRGGSFGWVCLAVLVTEIVFIEIIEKRRKRIETVSAVEAVRAKLRAMDKSLLAGTLQAESIYSIKVISYQLYSEFIYAYIIRFLYIIFRISRFQ